MSRTTAPGRIAPHAQPAISSIAVAGFKSIAEEQELEVRPLTLLAGANSSGKSSMMQPLLLLKQTLEAQYDPGPLLLNGPNAKFTSARQFFSSTISPSESLRFSTKISDSTNAHVAWGFRLDSKRKGIDLEYNIFNIGNLFNLKHHDIKITENMMISKILELIKYSGYSEQFLQGIVGKIGDVHFKISRDRCYFLVDAEGSNPQAFFLRILNPGDVIGQHIQEAIHLPGLRGNPERTYPVTAVGPRFPGTFDAYVASLIARWGSESPETLQALCEDLKHLGLTWKVEAKRVDDTQVEIRVGRLKLPKRGGARDLVNVADVGFGVSQTLPVVAALHAANPGQLVYIEQPEIHLHPRAQVAMARLLANAAKRGVRVVVETHSSLLLLGVQALVAEGELPPALVKLNWFLRDDDGTTRVQPADLDEAGRFGDWPEDFADVALEAENRYLSAAEARLSGR